MNQSALSFADLEDDINAVATKPDREQYPCVRCSGSGTATWGYVNIRSGPCNVCNGRGFFLSSPDQRMKVSRQRLARKAKAQGVIATEAKTFAKEHFVLVTFLDQNRWSAFANDLRFAIEKNGTLTERQLAAANSMMAKCQAKTVAKDAAKPTITLAKINDLFAVAIGNGAKKPAVVVGMLRLSLAPSTGANAGFIYVKDDGDYAGKISPTGVFSAIRDCRAEVAVELAALATDPADAMIKHGKATGQCSCCARVLTKQISIDAGIGPICAEKYGLFTY